jgi:hypothetical protein
MQGDEGGKLRTLGMKRFTETTKWEDPWYRKLKPKFKAFFQYLVDRCDSAGVWVVDMDLAATYVGERIDPDGALKAFDGRVVDMTEGKWLIPGFIPFQYGELTHDCKPHRPIFSLISKHGLVKNGKGYRKGIDTLSDISRKGTVTLEDKEKEQEKDKEGGLGEPLLVLPSVEPELSIQEFADEIFAVYPRKEGKLDGIKSIKEAFKVIAPLELRCKVQAYAAAVSQWPSDQWRFVPWCQKWMNKRRWMDDPSSWVRSEASQPVNARNSGVSQDVAQQSNLIALAVAAQEKARKAQ